MQFYSHLGIKAKSPRESVYLTEVVEAISFQGDEWYRVSNPTDDRGEVGSLFVHDQNES